MSNRRQEALDYHSQGRPGKIQVSPTKPFKNQRDLSLAYTPGVAEPCLEIAQRPEEAYTYTAKGNLVAVVTNGTAVLGLGNIGPLAGKPVMEGKGILFKAFADIDVFDLEVGSEDPEDVIRFCQLLEPTVGGINLEDIRSPDCFYIEEKLRETLSIPVFHDDQHGTAIISGAALPNALELVGKDRGTVQVVFAGAGAAAIATAEHYVRLGVKREHILVCDHEGVMSSERTDLDRYSSRFARKTKARTLAQALQDADVFVGLSVGGIVSGDMLRGMAPRPIVFALANPTPEIMPEEARQARSDAIIATGRSDFPNQVNNVLGFPFIFRRALEPGTAAGGPADRLSRGGGSPDPQGGAHPRRRRDRRADPARRPRRDAPPGRRRRRDTRGHRAGQSAHQCAPGRLRAGAVGAPPAQGNHAARGAGPRARPDVPRALDAPGRPGGRGGGGRRHVLLGRHPPRPRGDRGPAGAPARQRNLHARVGAADAVLRRLHREHRSLCRHAGGDRLRHRRVRGTTRDRAPSGVAVVLEFRLGAPPGGREGAAGGEPAARARAGIAGGR